MRRWDFLLTLFLIGALIGPVSGSQSDLTGTEGQLSASLDRESAEVGSLVALTLTYHLPAGGRLPEELEVTGLEELNVLERVREGDRIEISLLVDRLGSWKSGPLTLSYLDEDGNSGTLKTDPVSLTVLSNLGEKPAEAQLRPIQGIIPIRPGWLKYMPWIAGLIGVLLAGGALILWFRRRRLRDASIALKDPPYVLAQREIEQLEAQGLFEKGYIKEFYFTFSQILRRYLESLRSFPAAEFTTEEIAQRLNKEKDRTLLPLLRQADLVKFADAIPTRAGKEEDIKTALCYIQETGPSPEGDPYTTSSPPDRPSVPGLQKGRLEVSP